MISPIPRKRFSHMVSAARGIRAIPNLLSTVNPGFGLGLLPVERKYDTLLPERGHRKDVFFFLNDELHTVQLQHVRLRQR